MGMAGELGREAMQHPCCVLSNGRSIGTSNARVLSSSATRWGSEIKQGSSSKRQQLRPAACQHHTLLRCNARDSNTTVSPVKSYCRFLEAGAAVFFSLSRAAFLPSPYGVSPLAFFSAARRASKSSSSSSAARGRQIHVIAG